MKRLLGLSAIIGLFILSGCLDTVEETTFNDDGSGIYVTTADMSKMFAMLGAMGTDNDKMKDIEKLDYDTTMALIDMKDSSINLTAEERKLIEKGTARLIMNYKKEKFSASFSIPFSKPADIAAINKLLKSATGTAFSKGLKKAVPGGEKGDDEDMPLMGDGDGGGKPDLSDYFDFTYEKSKLKKKVNKAKYAKVKDDKDLQSLMEMGQMGMPVSFKTVINLPKPAKKAEGKGVKLSDDKKTITIEGTLDDFMEDASKFEYEIEY